MLSPTNRRFNWMGVLVIVSLIAVLVGSCAAPPQPTPEPTKAVIAATPTAAPSPTKPPAPTPTPAPKQVLIFPNIGITEPPTTDPALAGDGNSVEVVSLVYSGLVKQDKDLRPVPDAATKWEVSKDGLVYTFYLRNDIKFSDGTPCTAEDFAYSINRTLNPATKSRQAKAYLGIIAGATDVLEGKAATASGVKVLDPLKLQITLTKPISFFLDTFYFTTSAAVKRAAVEANKGDFTKVETNIGTGPFMIKSWVHGAEMVLVPNPYWYGGKLQLAEYRMPFVKDAATAYKMYLTDEAHLTTVPSDNIAEAEKQPDFVRAPRLRVATLVLNLKHPPLDNPKVRQALAHALDRATIDNVVLRGQLAPIKGIIPPGMMGYNPNIKGYNYDLNKAKQLLAEAGYPGGKGLPPLTLSYPTGGPDPETTRTVTAMQQMWKEVGIEVKLNGMEFGAFLKARNDHTLPFIYTGWGADWPHPQNYLSLLLHSGLPTNWCEYSNPKYDQLVDQADVTFADEKKQLALYAEAEQMAISDVAWIPIGSHVRMYRLKPYVHGFVPYPSWMLGVMAPDWTKVYLSAH
ncbi:MAG: peptide ABC transporter substrate-binding protein [Chloroflexi bacterium]|nr:peptide ABC transporter substrate-binding protein [Chloroflexota bacterium]MCL5075265.1 peptide ABC transporter substrate-binding protein [Chloroflexota bacterium]